jgi:hypothetical protein
VSLDPTVADQQPRARDLSARSEGVSSLVGLGGLLAIGGVPVFLFRRAGVSYSWSVCGGAMWAMGLVAKRRAHLLMAALRGDPIRFRWAASACDGAISALAELLPALMCFAVRQPQRNREVLAVGAGAGPTEALYVLVLALTHPPDPDNVASWEREQGRSVLVRQFVLFERSIAFASHMASRGLVALALNGSRVMRPKALLTALALFTLADSLAVYGRLLTGPGSMLALPGEHMLSTPLSRPRSLCCTDGGL